MAKLIFKINKDFKGHAGRKGQVGGSIPKGTGLSSLDDIADYVSRNSLFHMDGNTITAIHGKNKAVIKKVSTKFHVTLYRSGMKMLDEYRPYHINTLSSVDRLIKTYGKPSSLVYS